MADFLTQFAVNSQRAHNNEYLRQQEALGQLQNRLFQGSPEQTVQRHAMTLDQQDRERSERLFNQLYGYLSGNGANTFDASAEFDDSLGIEKRLGSLLDDPSKIQETGAYRFRLGQGQQALERSLGAKGLLGSGNRLMELTRYGQDMASQEYENQFRRLSDLLGDRLNARVNARANMFGSLANVLGAGALGRGGTDSIWDAYKAGRAGAYDLASTYANARAQVGAAQASAAPQLTAANTQRMTAMYRPGPPTVGRSTPKASTWGRLG